MLRVDFISQLDELKRRLRPVVYGGWALVFLFDLAVICYIFYRFPPRARNLEGLLWYVAGFVITSMTFVALAIVVRRTIARHAPACPGCGSRATWRERPQILSSGRCPKCGTEFVQDAA